MSTIAIGDKAEDNNWQIDGSLQSRIASEVTRGLHWFWSSTPLEQPVGATMITFYRGPIDCREWGPVESDGAPSLLSAADHLRRETSKTYCVWVKISFCLFVLRYKLIISFQQCRLKDSGMIRGCLLPDTFLLFFILCILLFTACCILLSMPSHLHHSSPLQWLHVMLMLWLWLVSPV